MGNVFIVITIVVAGTLVATGLVKILFKIAELEEGTKQDMTLLAFIGFSLVLLLGVLPEVLAQIVFYLRGVLNG